MRSERFWQRKKLEERYPKLYEALMIEKKGMFGYCINRNEIYIMFEDYYVNTEYNSRYYISKSIIILKPNHKNMKFFLLEGNSFNLNNSGFSHSSQMGDLCIGQAYTTPLKDCYLELCEDMNNSSLDEEIDIDDYVYFLKLLDSYVRFESIEGVPYYRFNHSIFGIERVLTPLVEIDDNRIESDINIDDFLFEISLECVKKDQDLHCSNHPIYSLIKDRNNTQSKIGGSVVSERLVKTIEEKGFVDIIAVNSSNKYTLGYEPSGYSYIGDYTVGELISKSSNSKMKKKPIRISSAFVTNSQNETVEIKIKQQINSIKSNINDARISQTRTIN